MSSFLGIGGGGGISGSTEDQLKFKYSSSSATDIVSNTGNVDSYNDAQGVKIPLLSANVTKNIGDIIKIDEANNAIEFLQTISGDLVIEIDSFDTGGTNTSLFSLWAGNLTDEIATASNFMATGERGYLELTIRDRSYIAGDKIDMIFGNFGGETIGVRGVRLYFYESQKTVVNTTDIPVNDQTNYIEIGTKLIQSGTYTGGSSNGDIVFDAPFADNEYSFLVTVQYAGLDKVFQVTTSAKTVSQIHFDKVFLASGSSTVGNASGEFFDWIAIGDKP